MSDRIVPLVAHFSTVPSTAVKKGAEGSFSRGGEGENDEFVVATQNSLELFRIDGARNCYELIARQTFFAVIRNIATLPAHSVAAGDHGAFADLLVVTSDSGYLSILRFFPERKQWDAVSNELIGRSGVRASVPGEYLHVDTNGRCIFVCAPMKEKLLFPVRTDSSAPGRLVLGSPLEARRNTIVHSVCAIEGVDSMFATLESQIGSSNSPMQLCFYQYDSNLNQVNLASREAPSEATYLCSFSNNVRGVLVCCAKEAYWIPTPDTKMSVSAAVMIPVPDRQPIPGSVMIGSTSLRSAKFFLVQNDFGDLFRVFLSGNSIGAIQFFGHIAAASSLLILQGGFLFCAAQSGGHSIFKIARDGFESPHCGQVTFKGKSIPTFLRDNLPRNIELLQSASSNAPTCATSFSRNADGKLKISSISGQSFNSISYGLPSSRIGEILLPRFDKLFSLRNPIPLPKMGGQVTIEWDSRILVSFNQSTKVFIAKGKAIEEMEDVLAFDRTAPTIAVSLLEGGAFLQVTPRSVNLVQGGQRITWIPSNHEGIGERQISFSAANRHQVVVAFAGGGVATLRLDGGRLKVIAYNLALPQVVSGCIPPVRDGILPQIVGLATDKFSFYDIKTLKRLTSESLDSGKDGHISHSLLSYMSDRNLYAFLGTDDGRLLRVSVNSSTGNMQDYKEYRVGRQPCRILEGDSDSYIYAVSDTTWRCSLLGGSQTNIPITLPSPPVATFDTAAGHSCLLVPEVIGGEEVVTVYNVDSKTGSLFTIVPKPLEGQAKKMARHPNKNIHVITGKNSDGLTFLQTVDLDGVETSTHTLPESHVVVSLAVGCLKGLGSEPVAIAGVSVRQRGEKTGQSYLKVNPFIGSTLSTQDPLFTTIPDIPSALHVTSTGHVIVGMGAEHGLLMLRPGKRVLMREHGLPALPGRIVAIDSVPRDNSEGFLLACGTAESSVFLVRYQSSHSRQFLAVVGHDSVPRLLTSLRFVDDRTVVCGDRLGTISFLQVPTDLVEDIPFSGLRDDVFSARSNQTLVTCHQFYIGQLVNSFEVMQVGGTVVVLYATVVGGCGCFVPFQREEDAVLAAIAEPHIRDAYTSPLGRSVEAFRAAISPSVAVIDGDLLLTYVENGSSLSKENKETVQKAIARDTLRSNREIEKLLKDVERSFDDIGLILSRMKSMCII